MRLSCTQRYIRAQVLLILAAGLTSVFAITINETSLNHLDENSTSLDPEKISTESLSPGNSTVRRSRHIMVDRIEIPASVNKPKRQVIKIPSDVSKVKLVRPPLNLRHNRAPQQFKRFPPGFRGGNGRRPNGKRSPQLEDDYDYDGYNGNVVKRNSKRPKIKEVTRQEFYEDDDFDFDAFNQSPKALKGLTKKFRSKRKNQKKNYFRDYVSSYDEDERPEKQEAESFRNRYRGTSAYEDQTLYGFDSAASNVHIKKVHSGSNGFGLKIVNPPEVVKHSAQALESSDKFSDYITEQSIQKLPTKGRQIQSLFSQQYTTHNPHVATNFGLTNLANVNGLQYVPQGSYIDSTPFSFSTTLGKYNQPTLAASEQVVTALPALNPGIQVIQPPQFRDVTVGHPSHPSRLVSSLSQQSQETSSQKATIRDILDQDCPGYDIKGYCESPPRYPMHQIDLIVKKCANLMEAMNTQPFDEPLDIFGFSSRSDHDSQSDNQTLSDFEPEKLSSWSRSGYESTTACHSELHITEPGYAKEVISGRWFVIVQNPDTTIQRITTDTCKNPGKSCGGLSSLKCSKGLKSTRCVQRFTHQKLISWDPESPDVCPRIRVFRFPSACLCNLGII